MLTRPTPARRRRRDDWHRTDGGVWLPGAADVPRVAGDPMRGAGMVRRGMGFGFEPAGCCCTTGGCGEYGACLYPPADTILASISGVVDDERDCVWANGDYEAASPYGDYTPPYCVTSWSLWFNRNIPCYGIYSCLIQVVFSIDQTGATLGYIGRYRGVTVTPHRCAAGFTARNLEPGVLTPFDNSSSQTWSTWNDIYQTPGYCDLSSLAVTVEVP
jgi:hypothetical protein